ncbi:DciA family protein [Temperatibacter marinus]|uniref:DciA family protein n=1 Tax=Temperatibacter marinus TaxID=1456591 RepID=A0AA52H8C5_9PROT|nr:DciA family protein [Temperatibacter marinus]WND01986.1 DciA family protein [Temperatibacter marinus]
MAAKSKKAIVGNKRSFRRQTAGTLARALTDKAIRQKGFMKAELITKWPLIVGREFADSVMPVSLKFPPGKRRGATLEVRTQSAFAPILQQSQSRILNKLNIYFGYSAIEKISIKQGAMPQKKTRLERQVKPLNHQETQIIDQITNGHDESDLGKAVKSMLTTVFSTKKF